MLSWIERILDHSQLHLIDNYDNIRPKVEFRVRLCWDDSTVQTINNNIAKNICSHGNHHLLAVKIFLAINNLIKIFHTF